MRVKRTGAHMKCRPVRKEPASSDPTGGQVVVVGLPCGAKLAEQGPSLAFGSEAKVPAVGVSFCAGATDHHPSLSTRATASPRFFASVSAALASRSDLCLPRQDASPAGRCLISTGPRKLAGAEIAVH